MDTSYFDNIQTKDAPLPELVAARISQLIIDQHLTYKDKLPNEFDLAAQLNVGRGTIREAVKLLVARNVLVIRRGKGTYIAQNPGEISDPLGFAYYPDQMELAFDLLEVRIHLEPWVASEAAKHATEKDLALLKEKCAQVEEDILSGKNHLNRDKEFHIAVAQCTQNLVVPKLVPIITYAVGLFGTLTSNKLRSETIFGHRAVTEAICAKESETAEKAMKRHLEENRMELERILRKQQPKS